MWASLPNPCHSERRRSYAKRRIFAVEEPAFCPRRNQTRKDGRTQSTMAIARARKSATANAGERSRPKFASPSTTPAHLGSHFSIVRKHSKSLSFRAKKIIREAKDLRSRGTCFLPAAPRNPGAGWPTLSLPASPIPRLPHPLRFSKGGYHNCVHRCSLLSPPVATISDSAPPPRVSSRRTQKAASSTPKIIASRMIFFARNDRNLGDAFGTLVSGHGLSRAKLVNARFNARTKSAPKLCKFLVNAHFWCNSPEPPDCIPNINLQIVAQFPFKLAILDL